MFQSCNECSGLAIDLYTMPDERRLCDFCSTRALQTPVVTHKVRVYSNTQYAIKQKYGKIKVWSDTFGFSPVTVSNFLRWQPEKIRKEKLSKSEKEIIRALVISGFTSELLNDELVTVEQLKGDRS